VIFTVKGRYNGEVLMRFRAKSLLEALKKFHDAEEDEILIQLQARNAKLEQFARLVRTEIAMMDSVLVCHWSHSGNEIRRILTELEEP